MKPRPFKTVLQTAFFRKLLKCCATQNAPPKIDWTDGFFRKLGRAVSRLGRADGQHRCRYDCKSCRYVERNARAEVLPQFTCDEARSQRGDTGCEEVNS